MRRLVFLALLLALAAGIPADAGTFLAMSQRDLVRGSAAVVEGEVLQVHSFWEPSGQIIVTEAIIKVADSIVGDAGSAVVVRTFGGTVEGFTIEAHGFPTFTRGERLLLYLEPERDGAHRIAGHQLGQYRIGRDKNGFDMAVPTFDGAAVLLTRDGRPAPRPAAVALDALKDRIRAEARGLGRTEQ